MILQNNLEQTTNLTDVIDHSTDIFENAVGLFSESSMYIYIK